MLEYKVAQLAHSAIAGNSNNILAVLLAHRAVVGLAIKRHETQVRYPRVIAPVLKATFH